MSSFFASYWLPVAGYAVMFSGLIVSFSRSAWVVFLVGFILLVVLRKEKRKELSKIGFVFFAVALIWVSALSPLFFSRIQLQERLERKSFDDRSAYILQAKEIISENFWIGAGAGNYTLAARQSDANLQINANPRIAKNNNAVWQYQPVHNVFLLVWAELGIIGLLLLVIFLIAVLFKTFQLNVLPGFLLFTFYFLLHVDHWLWTSHFGIIFFFCIVGLLTSKNYHHSTTVE